MTNLKAWEFTKDFTIVVGPPVIAILAIPSTLAIEIKCLFVFDYWIALAIIYLIYKTRNIHDEEQ
jgi:hypothetical protein